MKMDGRSILAYFRDRNSAEDAAAELRSSGYNEMQITNFSRYPGGDTKTSRRRSITGAVGGLASMTMEAAGGDDTDILMAADPAAQGMAGTSHVHSRSWLLTVVTDDPHLDEALTTLRKHGALV